MQLRWWGHTIFAAGYCAVAAVTVLLLVVLRPPIDLVVIVLAGAVVVLAGGLIHEVVTRRAAERKLLQRQMRMRQAYEDLVDMILKLKPPKPKAEAAPKAETHEIGGEAAAPSHPVDTPPRRAPPKLPRPPASYTPPAEAAPPPLSPAEAETVAMIREALAEERVEAFLQPIVALPARKHRFFEVLSRIRLPDGSLILPERYLALAEREKLLPAIDELCLARAIGLIRETDRHHHAIGFFCNLSVSTLGDGAFQARFLGGGGDPHNLGAKLVFELSQRDLTAELASSLSVVTELAGVGFRFSMDRVERLDIDVAALVQHQVRYLKLNCDFFIRPETRSAVMDLRRRLEGQPVDVIVEKIETERQLLDLEDLGLEFAQGYLFGEPRLSRRSA